MKKKDNKTSELITNTTQNNLLPQTAKLLAVNIVTGGVILILTVGIRIALRFVNSLANLMINTVLLLESKSLDTMVHLTLLREHSMLRMERFFTRESSKFVKTAASVIHRLSFQRDLVR